MSAESIPAPSGPPTRWWGWALGGTGLGFILVMAVLIGSFGAALGSHVAPTGGFAPSTRAVADIPPAYLRLYQGAGAKYAIDWAILAGIGSIETDHGRSQADGVRSGVNGFGCCAGPMQFNIRNGPPSTWDTYGHGGDVYSPDDAIPAAARMLVANGAPGDYTRAILAYNHDQWYLHQVLAKAGAYRGAFEVGSEPTDLVSEANRMVRLHRPYQWGGGHANFSPDGPWDCSGAMSWLMHRLGLLEAGTPIDSAAFMTEGVAGRGHEFTIWSNPGHVFLIVETGPHTGQAWGTASHDLAGNADPDGGPHWHHHTTAGFTPRHYPGH